MVWEEVWRSKAGKHAGVRGHRTWSPTVVKEAVRQEEGEDEPPSSIMPTYLSKAWAPLWGAHLALLFYHPLASTLAQGLLEKMSQQCAYWCRVCVCVCV